MARTNWTLASACLCALAACGSKGAGDAATSAPQTPAPAASGSVEGSVAAANTATAASEKPSAAGPSGATGASGAGAASGEVAEAPAKAEPSVARATGPGKGVDVVVLRGHELLGSENRMVDKYVAALAKGGLDARHIGEPSAERRAALTAWLDTTDPAARAALATDVALGDAAAVIVTRIEAPVRRVARGANAFALLVRGDQPEVVWMNLDGAGQATMGDDVKLVMPLLEGVQGVTK